MSHPPADVQIDEQLIRGLLRQAPRYTALPLRFMAHGYDNELWRLGDEYLVRLPRRRSAAHLLLNEIRWLGDIATLVPLAVPTVLFAGQPDDVYPFRWTITSWLPGEPATLLSPIQRDSYAESFAAVLRSLHVPAPPDAPVSPYRGVPLSRRADRVTQLLPRLGERGRRLLEIFHDGLAADLYTGAPVWLHGDPHPFNVLTRDGRLSALLDFGDVCCGDPASDLGTAWLHFTAEGLQRFVDAYGIDANTLARARGWATFYAAFLTELDPDHPLTACGQNAVELLS